MDNRRPERDRPKDRGTSGQPGAGGDRSAARAGGGGRSGGGRSTARAAGKPSTGPKGWTPHTRGERGDRPERSGRGERTNRGEGAQRRDDRPEPPREPPRPGLARKANEPAIPEGVDTRELHRSVRAELRGLPKDLAEIVASHLVAAGQLIDEDPGLAHAHAEAARRRAARLPIVREAAAETAYAAEHYAVALSEFRALRRMTGTHDYLPVMADCERALGRPQSALKLAKESHRFELDPAQQVEMTIVEAGARADLGQHAESLRILKAATESFDAPGDTAQIAKARLRYAYADALLHASREGEARTWFAAAATLDPEGETDAQDRVDELDGLLIQFDESEEGEESEESEPGEALGDGRLTAR